MQRRPRARSHGQVAARFREFATVRAMETRAAAAAAAAAAPPAAGAGAVPAAAGASESAAAGASESAAAGAVAGEGGETREGGWGSGKPCKLRLRVAQVASH